MTLIEAAKNVDPWAWLSQPTAPWWATILTGLVTGGFALASAYLTWNLTQRTTQKERDIQRADRVRAVGQDHARQALDEIRDLQPLAPGEGLRRALAHIRLVPDPDVRKTVGRLSALESMPYTVGWWDSDERKPTLGMMEARFRQAGMNALESWIREEKITPADREDLNGIANRVEHLAGATYPLGRPTETWPVADWANGNPEA